MTLPGSRQNGSSCFFSTSQLSKSKPCHCTAHQESGPISCPAQMGWHKNSGHLVFCLCLRLKWTAPCEQVCRLPAGQSKRRQASWQVLRAALCRWRWWHLQLASSELRKAISCQLRGVLTRARSILSRYFSPGAPLYRPEAPSWPVCSSLSPFRSHRQTCRHYLLLRNSLDWKTIGFHFGFLSFSLSLFLPASASTLLPASYTHGPPARLHIWPEAASKAILFEH